MTQKNFHKLILAAALAGAALTACQPKSTPSTSGDEGEAVLLGPQYSAKNGLLVPEETRQSLGVQIVEVTEQKVGRRSNFHCAFIRATESNGLASAAVTPEQAKALKAGRRLPERHSFTGKVTRLNDELAKATGTIEVLVEFRIRAGRGEGRSFLSARVTLDTATNVVTIPRAALLQCSDGYSVYTVSGEHLVRTPVKVGAVNDDFVEIKDGLYAGDQVVLQPVMSLWMTELAAVKGGQACCVEPPKGK